MKRFTLTAENRAEVIPHIGQYLKSLNCEKPQNVVVDDKKETRRNQQNRLYWKWVSVIGDELGYERTEMHDALILELIGMVDKEIMGKTIQTLPTTHDMKVADFSDYMKRVSRFAGKAGIRLPIEDGVMA